MAVKNPKDLFVNLLSDVRQREERTTKIFKEMSQAVEDPDIKEALESRVFVENQILSSLDQCFKLIGEKPVQLDQRMHDIFLEDFRRELGEIQSPLAKALFVIAKANHLVHLRIGEYVALIAMADITGHYGVGTLLESCLADKRAFVERTRRRIRNIVESEVAAGVA
jgi:ferritin-like metal-binding protein YciE